MPTQTLIIPQPFENRFNEYNRPTVIITAGGTMVPIDDVRFITNRSAGNFPWQIALAFQRLGWRVKVIASKQLADRVTRDPLPTHLDVKPFVTYEDLVRELELAIRHSSGCLNALLMAAAVSDYGASPTAGKISSEQDTLTITLHRLPKILAGLYQRINNRRPDVRNPHTCLVGFKLTSNAPREDMLAAARRQLTEYRCNLSVANDLSQIKDGQHPVTVVTPEGGAVPIIGQRDDVARQLAAFIDQRVHTTWWHSSRCSMNYPRQPEAGFDPQLKSRDDFSAAKKLLTTAQEMGLFMGSAGNVSLKTTITYSAPFSHLRFAGLWTTPRGWLNKSHMSDEYLIRVDTDQGFNCDKDSPVLSYNAMIPSLKPSIDTGVHATLYAALSDIGLLIHTHSPWVLTDRVTTFPYPCGTQEEAREILLSLKFDLDKPADRFAITLIHHGALIGRPKEELDQLIAEWHTVRDEYMQHLEEVQQLARGPEVTLFPIWGETVPIGIAARHVEGWYALHLSPQFRGLGWGEKLRRVLIDRRYQVGTIDACHVGPYYRDHGFTQTDTRADGTMIFDPPALEA